MQKGVIYMNSLDYFSSLKDESNVMDIRADPYENIHGVARASQTASYSNKLVFEIDGRQFDLGKKQLPALNMIILRILLFFAWVVLLTMKMEK